MKEHNFIRTNQEHNLEKYRNVDQEHICTDQASKTYDPIHK